MLANWFKRGKSNGKQANGLYQNGNEHLIELRHVVKSFDTAAGVFTALRGVDLRVNAGEFVAVIGKSGSGKSTLINMITGIDRPTSGEVFLGDTAIHRLNEGQMAVWRGRNLGIVFQFFQLLPTLTIAENIMLPMDFCNMYAPRERRKRAMHLLDLVDMTAHANKLPSAVSGGQQQRVAIARALANDPPILMADEPTGNLDSVTADSVFQLFASLVEQGKTILMVTHDKDLATRVTRSVIISDGQIIEQSLASTFPTLDDKMLVDITHRLDPDVYAPGDIVVNEGTAAAQFYIIMKGKVDVLVHEPGGATRVVATLERGHYFGEIELLTGRPYIATIRAAADTGVEVARLDRQAFDDLMARAPDVRALIEQVARERVQENANARNSTAELAHA